MKHAIDSSYGRLSSAWSPMPVWPDSIPTTPPPLPDASANTRHGASDRHGMHAGPDTARSPQVLVARHMRRPPILFDSGLLASATHEQRVFRLDPMSAEDFEQVERRCLTNPPRVLVIDIELVRDAGAHALQHLRRRVPATDWLIGWEAPPSELDLAELAPMRGCIEWSIDADGLTRALDAVMAGRLWFPRPMIESLYLALQDLSASLAAPAAVGVPAAAGGASDALSARETEVLMYMRQGLSNKQIAERPDISVNTVKKHLAHAFEKRGICKRRQTIA